MTPTDRLVEHLLRGRVTPPVPGDPASQALSFDGADLSREAVRAGQAEGAAVRIDDRTNRVWVAFADLRGCSLKSAVLSNVYFEGADFTNADLARACLAGAQLGGATFDNALLEEADLRSAHLRFATLRGAVLEGASVNDADLRGAVLEGSDLDRADLRGADLEEADFRKVEAKGVDFRGARCVVADFRGADLRRADFRDVVLRGTRFAGADLRGANLQGLDLTDCTLTGVRLSGASLDRTRMHRAQLGDAIGEELAGEYELARQGYLLLERNFADIGDPEAESWAYRRRRRVQKREALRRAREALRSRRWAGAAGSFIKYANDWVVEVACDYGESVPRVLVTIVAVVLLFTLWYGVSGGVLNEPSDPALPPETARSPLDLLRYSMTVMVSPSDPPPDLRAATKADQFVTIVQSYVGIFLIGLLGFVTGNRIRR